MTTLVAGIEVRGVIASVVPPSVIEVLAAALAIVAILGFAVMFVIDIYRIWSAPAGQTPVDNQAFLYVATALAALIGGFVAVSFGGETTFFRILDYPECAESWSSAPGRTGRTHRFGLSCHLPRTGGGSHRDVGGPSIRNHGTCQKSGAYIRWLAHPDC